jgi:hypothetical protein
MAQLLTYALHEAISFIYNSFIRKGLTNVLTVGLTSDLKGEAHEPQFVYLLFWLNSKDKGKVVPCA